MNFNVTFNDPTGTYANYYSDIRSNIVAAGLSWNKYIHGSGSLDINVDFTLTGTSVATGGSSFVFPGNGFVTVQSVAAKKLSTGIDQNGASADVNLNLNPIYLNGSNSLSLWFDPDPLARTAPTPFNKVDAVSVFTHELGHALAFIGFKNETNGTLTANYQTTFDEKTSFDGTNFFFTGPRATAVYGAPVPLTFGSINHVSNDAPRPGSNLLDDLMAPVSTAGQKYYISKLDLAILADCGLSIDPVRNDSNNDGKSDILWRNDNGSIALWTMNGATVTASSLTSVPSIDPSWKVAGTGDFNNDGKSDILWRNNNGSIALWTMNGATVTASALTSTPTLDNSWKVAGNSDFNGDGKADILWRNDDGSVALWQMNGAAITASTTVAKVSTDWKIAGTGDFNGDGKADLLWRNDNGSVALWQMDGAAITSSSQTSTPSLDNSWTVAGLGDYNGDGKSDISWRNTSGAVDIWQMNGATVTSSLLTSITADSSWKIAAPII
jgi:FG-GAP-like repeat